MFDILEALGHMMSLVKEARNARHQTNNLKASSSSSSNGLSSSPLAGVDLVSTQEFEKLVVKICRISIVF